MSAVNHWKRPRDRDTTDSVENSLCQPRDDVRLPSLQSQHYTGFISGEQSGSQSRRQSLAHVAPLAPPTIASPSPHRRIGFLDKAVQDGSGQWTLPNPMLHHPKKPRLGDYQFPDSQSTRSQSSITHEETQTYRHDEHRRQSKVSTEADQASRVRLGWIPTGREALNREVDQPQVPPIRADAYGASSRSSPCSTCTDAVGITDRLIQGLRQLQLEMTSISNRTAGRQRASEYENHDVEPTTAGEHGLPATLDWALDRVHASIRLAQDILRAQDSPPRSQEQNYNTYIPRGDSAQDRRWRQERPESNDGRAPSGSSPPSEDGRRISDVPGTPLTTDSRQRFHPLNPTSAHNVYPPLQSPMHAPSSSIRHLPSPSATNTSNILPPISPSYKMGNSPHTAHLQELQHQLSTKSLAHQILQGEHDKLLAAFSRSQTRCTTLDKKSKVSDQEINDLAEDRGRLQSLVDGLEQQVEELQISRDEAWRESAGSGKQYAEMMEQGMQLQIKGLDESKKWNEDRKRWQAEKREMLLRCTCRVRREEVESIPMMPERAASEPSPSIPSIDRIPPTHWNPPVQPQPATPPPASSGDVLTSASPNSLRAEIVRLRNAYTEAQNALKNTRAEYVHIDNIIDQLKAVNARIRGREDEEEFSKGRPGRRSREGGDGASGAHNNSRGNWARKEHTSSGPGSILFDDDADMGDHQNEDYGDF